MKYIEKMKPVIHQAGQLVMDYFRGDLVIHRKKDGSTATDADLASEELLKKGLLKIIPGSGFMAEESGDDQGNGYTWVIDPIDGTKNFSRGLPYFCVNVALMKDEQLVAAVTYYPAVDEWFYAELGHGTWHNGKKIDLSARNWEQKGALVVISDYRSRQAELLADIKSACKSLTHVRFRMFGAAALDMAYASVGTFDAVLFENLHWWDAAAGVLLLQEAGGMVVQYDGSEVDRSFKTLLGGHPDICKKILPILSTD